VSKKRAITMDDIAALAQVSKPTVSRALGDSPLVNAKTREHVLAIARQHGYAVNRNAQKLRHNRSNTIAVSIDFQSHQKNHVSDPFIFELLAGVSEALGDLNQDLLLTAPSHNDMNSFQQMLLSRGVDGFLFLGQGHRESIIEELAASGAPLVAWGARRSNTKYCVVGSDNFLGGTLAGSHFISQARSRWLFVGDLSHSEYYWRHAGLKQAADSCPDEIALDSVILNNFSYESAFEAAKKYIGGSSVLPDAVFAAGDTAAMAFIRALSDTGLRIPDEVSVVGYNDIPSVSFFSPPLTTIRQDTHKAGAQLVNKLMKIIEGKRVRSETIKTELIVRAT
jgi:DNA-binding LacI/PurR family transcriptional regulator